MPWKLNYSEQAPHRQHTLADGADRRHVSIRVNFQFVTDNQNCAPASRAKIIHLTMGPCNTISTRTISTTVSHLRPRQRGEPRVPKSICFFEVQAQTARRKAILSILTVSMFTVSPKQNRPTKWRFCFWRRGRDSNPRRPCDLSGFRDRYIQPLCHLSGGADSSRKCAARTLRPESNIEARCERMSATSTAVLRCASTRLALAA